jgi:HAE1 family hydrophobic/amphiphilic exporter-1
MKIVDVSIKQPVFITMMVILAIVLGLLAYTRLGVDLLPDISLPIVAVTTVQPGVGPEEIESQITKPIEDGLSGLNGIKKVSSTSSEGVAVVIAEFNLEKDAQLASTEVREKIASLRNTLPRDIQEPVIEKFDPAASPIVSYAITSANGHLSLAGLRETIEDHIKTALERVDGVGSVTLLGGQEREIHVLVDLKKLNRLNLSIAQVVNALRGENINMPAGRIRGREYDFLVRTKAEFQDLDLLPNLVVANLAGKPIYVKDVAQVKDEFKTRRAVSYANGVEAVTLLIRKQSGTNTVQVADGVKKVMQRLQARYPQLQILLAGDESIFIKESRDDVINSLIEATILTGLVVLLSFGDLRNTLITIAGLPVITIGTFMVMQLFGFTINVITLLGLSLSIGLIVDDAIVVRENIFRHMEQLGKDARSAAFDGTSEVGLAVIASTFTLVAVFLPVAFTTGIAGKFFREFGITVAAAILISMIEAFTLAPMLSAYFFKSVHNAPNSIAMRFQRAVTAFYDSLGRSYRPMIVWSLSHRKTIILITTVVFFISGYLFTLVGTGGSPRGDRPEFNLAVQCAPGSSLENTTAVVSGLEAIIRQQPAVTHIFTVVGTADGSSDEAMLNVKLRTGVDVKLFRDELRPTLTSVAGARLTFQEASALGGAASSTLRQLPIQINLKSANLQHLNQAAEQVRAALATVTGLTDLNSDFRPPKPEIQITVDRERAALLGANTQQIASAMRSFVDGDVASRYRSGEKQIDIKVRLQDQDRENLDRLNTAYIPLLRGGSVQLNQIADLRMANGPSQIKRSERTRQIMVGANLVVGTPLNEIKQRIEETLAGLQLPNDVTYQFGGQVEQNAEQFIALFISLILAILFVYMILASQFASFIQPFSIMLALPLSIIGAVLGLLAGNKLFDMVAFIGLIMLMGLVTKNSILLVDFTNVLRKRGVLRSEAIAEASIVRLRPIIMTTLSTIVGMIPVAFGLGVSSDFRAPIGYTIIGGMISSTLLTLIIVPVAYSILDDMVTWVRGRHR